MTQEQDKPINLSVHESSDPSVISPNPEREADSNSNYLDDAVDDASHENKNADFSSPIPGDVESEEQNASRQSTIANLSAG
jgi:hypothetical protein